MNIMIVNVLELMIISKVYIFKSIHDGYFTVVKFGLYVCMSEGHGRYTSPLSITGYVILRDAWLYVYMEGKCLWFCCV